MAVQTLETIWEVNDTLWAIVEPILLDFSPRKRTGRPPACWQGRLNGIIFQMRTSCQWNKLPKQFGDDSTVHRWFSVGRGRRLGADLGRTGRTLRRTAWCRVEMASGRRFARQSAFWGLNVGPNPTDRAKNGTKTNLVVEGQGGPLGVRPRRQTGTTPVVLKTCCFPSLWSVPKTRKSICCSTKGLTIRPVVKPPQPWATSPTSRPSVKTHDRADQVVANHDVGSSNERWLGYASAEEFLCIQQERRQLSRLAPTRMRIDLVPPLLETHPKTRFEIVT